MVIATEAAEWMALSAVPIGPRNESQTQYSPP